VGGMLGPAGHRGVLEQSAALQADGVAVIPQVSCRPLVVEFQMKAPFPLGSMSLFRPVSQADAAGKKRIYADPEFRAALRERTEAGPPGGRGRGMQTTGDGRPGGGLEDSKTRGPAPGPPLAERGWGDGAAERGVHRVVLILALALASVPEPRSRLAILTPDPAVVAELLVHPATMLGLSD